MNLLSYNTSQDQVRTRLLQRATADVMHWQRTLMDLTTLSAATQSMQDAEAPINATPPPHPLPLRKCTLSMSTPVHPQDPNKDPHCLRQNPLPQNPHI